VLAGSPLNDDVSLAAAGYAEQQFLFLVVSKPPAAAAHRDIYDSPGLDESFIERQRLLMIADMEAQRPSQQQRLLVSRRMGQRRSPEPNTGVNLCENPADGVMRMLAREQALLQANYDSQAAAAKRIVAKPGVIEAAASGNLELVTDHFLAEANCVRTTNGQYGSFFAPSLPQLLFPIFPNPLFCRKITALIMSSHFGHLEITQFLVESGAILEAKDIKYDTPKYVVFEMRC
jgi:hypothetical protein